MILIAGTVARLKVKKLCSHIRSFLQLESLYSTVGTVIAFLPELQQESPIAQTVQK